MARRTRRPWSGAGPRVSASTRSPASASASSSLLDTVKGLPRSGRTAAVASALPLVILRALCPGLPAGFLETDGMPPVPDKARTGRFFGRRMKEFQNWTLASNARWRLTDEQTGAAVAGGVSQLPHPVHDESVRTVRNLFNLGWRNNDRPPGADPPVRSRWESGAGHAVLPTPWMPTPYEGDLPVW